MALESGSVRLSWIGWPLSASIAEELWSNVGSKVAVPFPLCTLSTARNTAVALSGQTSSTIVEYGGRPNCESRCIWGIRYAPSSASLHMRVGDRCAFELNAIEQRIHRSRDSFTLVDPSLELLVEVAIDCDDQRASAAPPSPATSPLWGRSCVITSAGRSTMRRCIARSGEKR
jgi:hypothetical protein